MREGRLDDAVHLVSGHITHPETCPTGVVSRSQSSAPTNSRGGGCRARRGWSAGWLVVLVRFARYAVVQPDKKGQSVGDHRSFFVLGMVKKMACWVEPRAASCRPCVQASLAMSLSEGGCLRCCSRRAGKDKQTVAFLYWGHVRSDSGADA